MLALGCPQMPVAYNAPWPAQTGHIAPAGVLQFILIALHVNSARACCDDAELQPMCAVASHHKLSHDPGPALVQGCGKTTTCMKYAHFHKRKGFKPAMVCADTFRSVT